MNENYITHNEAVALVFKEYEKADKRRYTDLFLSSLNLREKNNFLVSLAYMKTFPKHEIQTLTEEIISSHGEGNREHMTKYYGCDTCALPSNTVYPIRKINGYLKCFLIPNPCQILLVLQEVNDLKDVPKPIKEDFEIFIQIITMLKSTNKKIGEFAKEFKQTDIFKNWVSLEKDYKKKMADNYKYPGTPSSYVSYSFAGVLDHLGCLGILHTDKHKGAFYEFTNPAKTPRPARICDWQYPVSFWKGSDGIDYTALSYWFSEYEELKVLFE